MVQTRNIRTLSHLSNKQTTEPHRLFMKISILEMEKARRQKEREKAMQRLQKIDSKIQQIDTEITELLSMLNLPTTQTTSSSSTQQPVKNERLQPQPQGQKLVLKY